MSNLKIIGNFSKDKNLKTIVSIVGARPQFIKLGILSKYLRRNFNEIIIHTGQHYDANMSDDFFNLLNIPKPDYNLDVGSGGHGYQTGNMLIKIEKLLNEIKPHYVVNYGDTNSTVAGSLAAVKLHIPSGHVEAGLRNFDLKIPEEVNRLITDKISNQLFAPTKQAIVNLRNEGITENCHLVGDVMYDSLLTYNNNIADEFNNLSITYGIKTKEFLLATIHRPSNTDDISILQNIFSNLSESNFVILLPLHPRTKNIVAQNNISYNRELIQIIEPVNYFESLALIKNAIKVITDSGGIQKEAYLLKTPCITIFPTTSWIETVEDGWNILVSNDNNELIEAIKHFQPEGKQSNHYGDGNACELILDKIVNYI